MRRAVAMLLTVATVALAGASVRAAAPSPSAGCPSPQRCRLYRLGADRFAAVRGTLTIHYRMGTAQPWLTPKELQVAAHEAELAWERANPAVRFVLDGISSDLPVLGNEENEIAWTLMDPDVLAQTNVRAKGPRRLEADTLLNLAKPWGWQPCGGDFGPCADATSQMGLRLLDVQAMLTHTFGRWLGLEPLTGAAASNLTMYGGFEYGERHKSTLGLGDALGVRAAYPCRRCRMAPVATP